MADKDKMKKINKRINKQTREREAELLRDFWFRHADEKEKKLQEDLSPREVRKWEASCRSQMDDMWNGKSRWR